MLFTILLLCSHKLIKQQLHMQPRSCALLVSFNVIILESEERMMFIRWCFVKSLKIQVFSSVPTRPLCRSLMCSTLVAPMTCRCLYSSDLNCIGGGREGRIGGWWEPVCLKIQWSAVLPREIHSESDWFKKFPKYKGIDQFRQEILFM